MATATAARSPSPGPVRPSSPCCAALRRSADSTPFKPADCPQRRSKNGGGCGCHPSPRASLGEKENDQRDTARTTTPKARGSGGAKNFMAPTFSAASKAVAASASPRKKVLGERNEHQHLAPSFPCDLAHKPKGLPEGDLAHKPKGQPEVGAGTCRLRLSFDGAAPAPLPAASEASHGSRRSLGGEDAKLENPICKDHHHAMPDSLDAEPFREAPYNPKTNYLSPRPRFLRYKPNPRIEMYRHGGVRQLEDDFSSESSEETDITAAEDGEVKEEEKEPQAQQKPKPNEAPEEPSAQAAPAEAQVLPLAIVLTSEPAATSPPARLQIPGPRAASPRARAQTPEPELGASSAGGPAMKRSSRRFMLAALLLFIAAAFICVPPPPESPLMSKVSDYLPVQELHPVELAAWLKQLSSSSLDSIASYWEALASTKEQEFFGPPFAANLSAANVDADYDADFYYNFAETWQIPSEEPIYAGVLEELIQDVVSESNTGLTSEPEAGDVVVEEESIDAVADGYKEVGEFDVEMSEEDVVVEELSIDAVSDGYKEVDELDVEISEEDLGNNGEEMSSSSQNLDIPSQPTTEAEQTEMEEEDVETNESEDDHANGKGGHEAYRGLKSDSSMWTGYLDKIPKPAAVGVALLAVILATGMATIYSRKKQAQVSANANASAEQAEEIITQSVSESSEGHLVKSSQFQSSMAEDFSQHSSSLSSSYGRRGKVKEDETPSLEPISKRESMTHSTSSYGSFTTLEKISAKKKNKDDDAMTPVRRSSRLRSVKSQES